MVITLFRIKGYGSHDDRVKPVRDVFVVLAWRWCLFKVRGLEWLYLPIRELTRQCPVDGDTDGKDLCRLIDSAAAKTFRCQVTWCSCPRILREDLDDTAKIDHLKTCSCYIFVTVDNDVLRFDVAVNKT